MLLLDSNLIIYYLNASVNEDLLNRLEELFLSAAISRITCTEVLSLSSYSDSDCKKLHQFLEDRFLVIEVDRAIAYHAAALRRKQKLHLPDALIAATALTLNRQLVSADSILCKKLQKTVVQSELFVI
jgi:predicted nucleic acid-binding protein